MTVTTFESLEAYEAQFCGAWRAKSGKVRCELPRNHANSPLGDIAHLGRDRAGRWHSWVGDRFRAAR